MVLIMYKYHLENVEWRAFKVGGNEGVFNVSNSKPYHKSNLNTAEYGIPYITRTSINNGLEDIVIDNNYEKNKKNSISLGAENADFFFQSIEYVTGNKMYHISNEKITRHIGLFLVQAFRQSIKNCGFGYGKGLTGTRFKNRYVLLPIDEAGCPNWRFMEGYIKERENNQRHELKDYYKDRLLDLVINPSVLIDVKWKEIPLQELFEFERGNQNNMSMCADGNIPLISAKKVDNGLKRFISDNGKKVFDRHILTLNNDGDGGVGIAYYQASNVAIDTHVTALIPKLPISREALLFISKTITTQRDKFSHGYSLNNNRIRAQKIVLPVNEDGNPNWTYIENFIKNIEKKQIKNLLKYLDEYIYIYI